MCQRRPDLYFIIKVVLWDVTFQTQQLSKYVYLCPKKSKSFQKIEHFFLKVGCITDQGHSRFSSQNLGITFVYVRH